MHPNQPKYHTNVPKSIQIKKYGSAACRERAKPVCRVNGRNLYNMLLTSYVCNYDVVLQTE